MKCLGQKTQYYAVCDKWTQQENQWSAIQEALTRPVTSELKQVRHN